MLKLFSWPVVILWMALIFYLSHQPATQSSKLSGSIVRSVERITPNSGFNTNSFHHFVRKNAHFFIYLILGVLMTNAFLTNGVSGYLGIGLPILSCALYAVSDEVHQRFVKGRGPQIKDVLIDSAGAIVGIVLFYICSGAY